MASDNPSVSRAVTHCPHCGQMSNRHDGLSDTTVHYGQDTAVSLDRDRALAYATTIVTAAARAEYDAAVLRQLTTVGVDVENAARLLGPDQARATVGKLSQHREDQ